MCYKNSFPSSFSSLSLMFWLHALYTANTFSFVQLGESIVDHFICELIFVGKYMLFYCPTGRVVCYGHFFFFFQNNGSSKLCIICIYCLCSWQNFISELKLFSIFEILQHSLRNLEKLIGHSKAFQIVSLIYQLQIIYFN